MAKQILPTDFVDDILASSMGGKRKFTITDNGDGTYEIEDVTDYTQTGSNFGAGQINATNQAVNESCDKANVIDDLDDIAANQADGMIAGAKAVAELNGNLNNRLKIEVVRFKTGSQINTNYRFPLPDGYYFYNTALLAFQVTVGIQLRDGLNGGFIETYYTGSYSIKNQDATNKDAFALICKYR